MNEEDISKSFAREWRKVNGCHWGRNPNIVIVQLFLKVSRWGRAAGELFSSRQGRGGQGEGVGRKG